MRRAFFAFALSLAACSARPADGVAGAAAASSAPHDDASTIDLGDVQPGRAITIDVPPDALGFVVVVSGADGGRVGIESLRDPSGHAVVDAFVPEGAAQQVALGNRGLGTIAVPMTNATATRPLASGRWTLTTGGITPDPNTPVDKSPGARVTGDPITTPLHVTVHVQRSNDGAFHGGTLDLHVYVPDGLRVHDPDSVHVVRDPASDASLARRVDVFYEELDRLFGISRGQVAFHAIDARFAHATTGDARASLIAQATVASGPALHVVLTNELSYGSGGETLLGYSVGLPGAPNTVGTVRSAIAVGLYDTSDAHNDAITFLHEMGHFAGLLHSVDYDGTPDLLDDTSGCDANAGKSCIDDNLMAPDGPVHAAQVSPSQVRIVRGAPFYRATR